MGYYDAMNYYSRGPSTWQIIISLAVSALMIACLWIVFKKAGKPGWAAIVPFYNLYILFEITWGKGIKFLLLLIPIANIVFLIMTMVKMAKVFGYGGGFAVGLIFLPIIFYPLLAFGNSKYIGVAAAGASQGYRQAGYQQQGRQQGGYSQAGYQQGGYQQQSYQPPQQSYQPPQPAEPSKPAFCPNCGAPLSPGSGFCGNCGQKL